MKNGKEKQEETKPTSSLPDVCFLLTKDGVEIKVKDLEGFTTENIKTLYLQAIEKYGISHVRYCRVVGTSIKTSISFDDTV